MRLKSVDFVQDKGSPREWSMKDLQLGDVNLIVGRNASGKTRTLNVIAGLSNLLSGRRKELYRSGDFLARFALGPTQAKYTLTYEDAAVLREDYEVDEKPLLQRATGGLGRLWAEKAQQFLEFQAPDKQLAAFVRRDDLQHPFFEPLYQWSSAFLHFYFGSSLAKDEYAILSHRPDAPNLDVRDAKPIAIIVQGLKRFGDDFKREVIAGMGELGYDIEDIGVTTPKSVEVVGAGGIVGIFVKEKELADITDQTDLSQGMHRVIVLLAHLAFARLTLKPTTLLIDDVGEGLDFERSCALVKLLMRKATDGAFQLVMTTNDRFVMNAVPLSAWSVVNRRGGQCEFLSYKNARKRFEEFQFTGLSNFDLFSTDFLTKATGDA